jgi:hypothetical protein
MKLRHWSALIHQAKWGLVGFGVVLLLAVGLSQLRQVSVPWQQGGQSSALSPLLKTQIGDRMDTGILHTVTNAELTQKDDQGKAVLSYSSEQIARPNIIESVHDAVVFERKLLPLDPTAEGYAKISDFKKKLGEPEKEASGSRYYGPYFKTYIYAGQGFAAIGNPNTDTVFEIQQFKPMSVDDYVTQYGSDITNTSKEAPHN